MAGLRSTSPPPQITTGVSAAVDVELAQQHLGAGVGLEVDPRVRQPVAGEELAEPARVGREPRADDAHAGAEPISSARRAQEAPQDQVVSAWSSATTLAQPRRAGPAMHPPALAYDGGEETAAGR